MAKSIIQSERGKVRHIKTLLESGISSSTGYYLVEKDITLDGYTPVAIGFETNQVSIYAYRCEVVGNRAYIGLASRNGNAIADLIVYANTTYVRTSLL